MTIEDLLGLAEEIRLLRLECLNLKADCNVLAGQVTDCQEALDAVKAPTSSPRSAELSLGGRIRAMTVPSYILEREAYFANQKAAALLEENQNLRRQLEELKG